MSAGPSLASASVNRGARVEVTSTASRLRSRVTVEVIFPGLTRGRFHVMEEEERPDTNPGAPPRLQFADCLRGGPLLHLGFPVVEVIQSQVGLPVAVTGKGGRQAHLICGIVC